MHKQTINCPQPECKHLQKFYLAIEGTSEQITITNPNGKIIYANRATRILTGYSQKEIIGNTPDLWAKNIWLRKQSNQRPYKDVFQNTLKNNCCFFGEVENINKKGEKYYTDVRITSIMDENNRAKFFVVTERDITVKKKLGQAQLDFLSIASHELRTPLASISLASELLLRSTNDKDDESKKFLTEEIYINSQRMAELISTCMNLTRVEMGAITVAPELINTEESLEKILSELSIQITNRNLKLQKSFSPDATFITYDKKIFLTIFDNLISNAIKYTREGGEIGVETKRRNGFVDIYIRDTGIGIAEKNFHRIFQRQFRTENAIKFKCDGDGLGLYIVKSMIEKTNAKISFTSKIDRGTTFKVTFPASQHRSYKHLI